MAFRRRSRSLLLVTTIGGFCLVCLIGCGQEYPNLHPVTGTVTFDGQPVPLGIITFYPKDGSRPATGTLGEDGSYRIITYDDVPGAVGGRHTVTIDATSEEMDHSEDGLAGKTTSVAPSMIEIAQRIRSERLVPLKYSRRDTSPLTAVVKPDKNVIDFDLTDD